MPFWKGKRLWIDLSKREVNSEILPESYARKWGGMRGLALPVLLEKVERDTDPLGPDNLMVIASGLLNGLGFHGACRYGVYGKSPLTGGFGGSDAGGYFGPGIRNQGVEALVISGASEDPVYLWVEDGDVKVMDATYLWGLETGPAFEKLKAEHGRISTILIGPAGENLVRYACIVNDLHHVNGRTGMGAVMGSKKIKAVVVPYPKALEPSDKDLLKAMQEEFSGWKEEPLSWNLHVHGTSAGVGANNKDGLLPTRNFQRSAFEGAASIDGKLMTETLLKDRYGCFACAVRCKRIVEGGKYNTDPSYGGPEYETLGALGSVCCIDDLDAVTKGHEVCNRLGLDTISAGMTIAWLMECIDNGVISSGEAGIRGFGDAEGMLSLLEKISRREGIGDLLAEGSLRAAKKLGKGSDRFVVAVKGQELPMHEPRGKKGVALGYAFSPTGADHMQFAHDPLFVYPDGLPMQNLKSLGVLEPLDPQSLKPDKVRAIIYLWFSWAVLNHLGGCYFVFGPRSYFPLYRMSPLVRSALGWETSLWELMKMGERGLNAARMFNLKMGLGASDDVLPERLSEPLLEGAFKGSSIGSEEFSEAKSLYYKMMGWDEEGVPSEEKLIELGLQELVDLSLG
ncbi:MAG TPA: aldehyde ferredoxin oxidoreductase family protein [Synergistales bacterium]|nr:aldehyde ferredoxin oxidoreductase family protein [Synergistales bacterium]